MKPLMTYACCNLDENVRFNSSSGGVFSMLAEFILLRQGIVYGVKMSDDCYSAEFTRVTDPDELVQLRGSKYLQAKVGNTYIKVKNDLLSGKTVLFTGLGCQINGLKNFLNKNYENLICIDVICHGVPSPALWRKYAKHQEKINGGKLTAINFRCKNASWSNYGMEEVLYETSMITEKKVYTCKEENSYMQMFLRDYCLRPSCYECVAKSVKMSDMTIADFWGINDVAPEMNDEKGTSLVLIRTDNGKKMFDAISKNLRLKEVSYKDGVRNNPAEYKSWYRPKQRDKFFVDMNSMEFEELEKKYAAPLKTTFKSRVKQKIKSTIKAILRKVKE